LKHHFPTQEENREEDENVYEIIPPVSRAPFITSASSPVDDGHYCPMADLRQPEHPDASSTPKSALPGNLSTSQRKLNKPMPPPKPVSYKLQAEREDRCKF